MPLLFAVTLFVSASLLFMVQPMVGKMILPLLGGSPAVWNACMVFFQALLLLGYLYAHHVSTKYEPKRQWACLVDATGGRSERGDFQQAIDSFDVFVVRHWEGKLGGIGG